MAQTTMFAWNQRSSIKIPGLEEQHTELFDFLATLTQSINGGKSREEQNRALVEFLDYAVYHFKKEAELIEKYGYVEYKHQYEAEQDLLKREFDKMRQRARRGDFVVDSKTLLFLKNALQTHIFSGEKYLIRRSEKI